MTQQEIIESIVQSYKDIGAINQYDDNDVSSRHSIHEILDKIKDLLFPGYFNITALDKDNLLYVTGQRVNILKEELIKEIVRTLAWDLRESGATFDLDHLEAKAIEIVNEFLAYIPDLRAKLKDDASAILKGDPAAKSLTEVFLAYPGFQAITVYRIANFLFKKNVPLIPRLMSEIVHSETGIDIHPGATIGRYFCIDHGTGVVIGETTDIGDNVKLYQGVTLGAFSVSKTNAQSKRHPTIKNNVTIYARSTILGGETTIGENATIGGNVWISKSIPANSTLYLTADYKQVIKKHDK